MSESTGPQYLRDVAMGLRRMGFPISAPSLEQLAAQWEADRAALEQAANDLMLSEESFVTMRAKRDEVLSELLTTRAERAEAANAQERAEWSRLYSLLTGDDGAWSFDDFARAIKSQREALWQLQSALYVRDHQHKAAQAALEQARALLADLVACGYECEAGALENNAAYRELAALLSPAAGGAA